MANCHYVHPSPIAGTPRAGDYFPTEEIARALAETAKTIISAICADRFGPTPSYQSCRFCDNADLCGVNGAGGSEPERISDF